MWLNVVHAICFSYYYLFLKTIWKGWVKIAMTLHYKHHEANKNRAETIVDILILPTILFWSHCHFSWKYNRVWGKVSVLPTAMGVERVNLSPSTSLSRTPWQETSVTVNGYSTIQVQVDVPRGQLEACSKVLCQPVLHSHLPPLLSSIVSLWACLL